MTAVVEGFDTVSRSVAELVGSGVVQSGSLVWAATVDRGPLAGWLVVDQDLEDGREQRCVVVMPDVCAVVASGPISEVQLLSGAVSTDEAMPEWVSALAAAFWANRGLRAERDELRGALRAKDQRLEEIVDAAHDYADDQSLCERFDRFMISQGLRPRVRSYVCTVNVTVQVSIPVSSHSDDAAGEKVDDEMVRRAVVALRGGDLADAIQDHELLDVDAA